VRFIISVYQPTSAACFGDELREACDETFGEPIGIGVGRIVPSEVRAAGGARVVLGGDLARGDLRAMAATNVGDRRDRAAPVQARRRHAGCNAKALVAAQMKALHEPEEDSSRLDLLQHPRISPPFGDVRMEETGAAGWRYGWPTMSQDLHHRSVSDA
jgi:hypothetical protein